MEILNKKILWMPIDLPKFPIANFSLDTKRNWMFWNFAKLTNIDSPKYSHSEIRKEIVKRYPELAEWIKLLPISSISNIKFNVQQSVVVPHIDFHSPDEGAELFTNNSNNEPCGYRVLISGSRTGKLYVVSGGEKIYVNMPNETDVYVLGQTNCMHGVEDEPGRSTMYFHFFVDPVAHKNLLERSFEKYKDYAIIEK